MEPDFWHQRWQDGLTGFHQRDSNPHLATFWSRLQIQPGEQVFVPLSGKSLDMLWLRKHYSVLGVELSPIAVEEFHKENGLVATHRWQGAFSVSETDNLCLLCGDYFDLQPVQLLCVRAVYDRAALVALPADMRPRYVSRLTSLLPASVSMLLVAMEYDKQQMKGPPFALDEKEVSDLFERHWSIQLLHEENILANEPGFRDRGLSRLSEKIYLLKKSFSGSFWDQRLST
ncbi:MAG: thiopurine S-methyltransferase [Thiogranum sp.]